MFVIYVLICQNLLPQNRENTTLTKNSRIFNKNIHDKTGHDLQKLVSQKFLSQAISTVKICNLYVKYVNGRNNHFSQN